MDPAYRERLAACGLDNAREVLVRVTGRIAAWSRTTDTLHVPAPNGSPGFYVKRHYFPRWRNRWRGAMRGTFFGRHRGRAEYLALNAMRRVGVPAVRGVAFGGQRLAHFLTACFLITEEVPDAVNLTTFAQDVVAGRRRLSRASRCAMVCTLARQLAYMHANGVSHGNLFWRNILVRHGPDGRPEYFFLDAQPLRPWERMRSRGSWWVRELAQVTVSALPFTTRADRLRFFHCYTEQSKLTAPIKEGLRQIEHQAGQWRRHEERRVRMNGLFEGWNRQLAEELHRLRHGGPIATIAEPGA